MCSHRVQVSNEIYVFFDKKFFTTYNIIGNYNEKRKDNSEPPKQVV